ncbi:unnamed protein product, partial [Ectocarpus fasciculatus]
LRARASVFFPRTSTGPLFISVLLVSVCGCVVFSLSHGIFRESRLCLQPDETPTARCITQTNVVPGTNQHPSCFSRHRQHSVGEWCGDTRALLLCLGGPEEIRRYKQQWGICRTVLSVTAPFLGPVPFVRTFVLLCRVTMSPSGV